MRHRIHHRDAHSWRCLLGGLMATTLTTTLFAACGQPGPEPHARVFTSGPGQTLTGPSSAAPREIVVGFLRDQGVGGLAASLELARNHGSATTGLVHLNLAQTVDGLRVAGGYVKATVNGRGELVHLIEHLLPVPEQGLAAPVIDEQQALGAALKHLGIAAAATATPALRGTLQGRAAFEPGSTFYSSPTVERVALLGRDEVLVSGFLVETWTRERNQLHETLVDGQGRVVAVQSRTSNDRYNVFVEDPLKGPQAVVNGPGAGNAESPAGWLGAGPQLTTGIHGNNVAAYLDVNHNNSPDKGGTPVANDDFLTVVNLAQEPSTASNREVAVQNLFYLNNVVHDSLYRLGFTEAAGNFQANNFGGGGADSDPVQAEAQDGSGTDNANFATPPDGRSPRMQMYLWTGVGATHEVVVNNVSYDAMGAEFGPALDAVGVTFPLVDAGSDGCAAFPAGAFNGRTVIIDRGTCNFTVKAVNAADAGAGSVIIANNAAGNDAFTMGGTARGLKVSAVMVGHDDGVTLKNLAGAAATSRRKAVQSLQIDGDIDADIVFHEYGHGLSWRMIGGMSGPIAGAIGEGMSDVVAFLSNGDDRIGEYSFSNPIGIRRAPYSGYPLTYKNVDGGEVHNDGEIYGAAMWRAVELFSGAGIPTSALAQLFVDGMNYTPATPMFEDVRDGMLQSDAASFNGAHACLIWRAFAQYGIGVGSQATITKKGTVTVQESFALPPGCQ